MSTSEIILTAALVAVVVLQLAVAVLLTRRERRDIDVHVHVDAPAVPASPELDEVIRGIEDTTRQVREATDGIRELRATSPAPAPEPPFVPSPSEPESVAPVAPEPEPAEEPPPTPEPTPRGRRRTVDRQAIRDEMLALLEANPDGVKQPELTGGNETRRRVLLVLQAEGLAVQTRKGGPGSGPSEWRAGGVAVPVPPEGAGAPAPLPEVKPAAPAKPPAKRTPPNAQLARVPDDLRDMPAVRGKDEARGSQITSAQKQLAVLTFVKSRATVVPAEVHAALPEIAQATIAGYLRELAGVGLIRLTGRGRYAKGQVRGKGGLEYAALEGEGKAKDAMARDFARSVGRPFTTRELALGCVISVRDAGAEIKTLREKGVVRLIANGDEIEKFEYVKPDGPGKAAEMDAAARKAAAAPVGANGNGGAVAGTGKGVKANNKDVQALINDCVRAGANVAHATNGHFVVTKSGMSRVLISATPSNPRSVLNDRARLRRAGLTV